MTVMGHSLRLSVTTTTPAGPCGPGDQCVRGVDRPGPFEPSRPRIDDRGLLLRSSCQRRLANRTRLWPLFGQRVAIPVRPRQPSRSSVWDMAVIEPAKQRTSNSRVAPQVDDEDRRAKQVAAQADP